LQKRDRNLVAVYFLTSSSTFGERDLVASFYGISPHELTRRQFMVNGAASLAFAAVLSQRRSWATEQKTENVEVETAWGRIRGHRTNGLAIFKGIPYGGSVSGKNRFKAAPPLKPWTGVRDALKSGAPALQSPLRPYFGISEGMPAEDCLYLNVWTPAADTQKRPVMFYSHGGGFTNGSGSAPYQDGGVLARKWDVVVVETNHRLGLMGFLFLGDLGGEEYATSGNQGLLDICDGLKWVHENIRAFGGDPENVMIFGESGGGAKTSCLYAMPAASLYFNKASIESGPGIRMFPRDMATETTLMVLKQLGIEKSQWRKLLEVPGDKLLQMQVDLGRRPAGGPLTMTGGRKGIGGGGHPGGFGPVVDGTVLPHHPFDPDAPAISKNKPLIVGYNRDETIFFLMESHNTDVFNLSEAALKQRLQTEFGSHADEILTAYRTSRPEASPSDLYIAISTARMIGLGSITIAERKFAQHGAPVYSYVFTHESNRIVPGTQHKVGAAHALEIAYKFDLIRPAQQPASGESEQTATRTTMDTDAGSVATAKNMSEMWSTFARTGKPGGKGQPDWVPYETSTRATMLIDAECKVADDPWRLEREVWEKLEPEGLT
jgi:para-nitrobenzyl esterase